MLLWRDCLRIISPLKSVRGFHLMGLACIVDVTRLSVYAGMAGSHLITENVGLVVAASLLAILGVHYSRNVLKKMTIQIVRALVGVMLLLLGGELAFRLI